MKPIRTILFVIENVLKRGEEQNLNAVVDAEDGQLCEKQEDVNAVPEAKDEHIHEEQEDVNAVAEDEEERAEQTDVTAEQLDGKDPKTIWLFERDFDSKAEQFLKQENCCSLYKKVCVRILIIFV